MKLGFPDSSVGKEYACNVGDLGSIPGLGRSPAEGKGYPLQYFGLENSMDCTGFHCPWDSPGKNTGVGCHALLQGIFPIQGLNSVLPHCRWILYHLSHQGSLIYIIGNYKKNQLGSYLIAIGISCRVTFPLNRATISFIEKNLFF